MASSLLFFLFFIFYSTVSSSFDDPYQVEDMALMKIKKNFNDFGDLDDWKDEDYSDHCSWSMIQCSSDRTVISIVGSNRILSGNLSPAIGNLSNLQHLSLENNIIRGEIPRELWLLLTLQTLDLSGNLLSGKIPDSIGKLTNLSYLDLSYNNLSGPVPIFHGITLINLEGNPLICGSMTKEECLKISMLPISSSLSKNQNVAVVLGSSFSAAFILLILSVVLYLYLRKNGRHQQPESEEEGGASVDVRVNNLLRQFSLQELLTATENFSEGCVLGHGGFGKVYEGKLSDGSVVAVKRLMNVGRTGEAQFKMEVEMISMAVHCNLLRLIGCCITPTERILVYPLMANGSLASRLRAKPPLEWSTRKRIAVGAARGLSYLHRQCNPKIIQRDVKAANILLDESYEAVVGDFGLVKLLDHDDSHVTTAIRGTVGHIAPEYMRSGQSSDKTDVYAFGIMLLELVTGKTLLHFSEEIHDNGGVFYWVKKVHQEDKVDTLVDGELGTNYDLTEAGEMIQIALFCIQYSPFHRPTMSNVVRLLEGEGLAFYRKTFNKAQSNFNDVEESGIFFGLVDAGGDSIEDMVLSGPR